MRLHNADITIEGKNENGESVELTGKVYDIAVETETDDERVNYRLVPNSSYYLKFVSGSDGDYRIKKDLRDVVHTARIEVDKLTVESLAAARERAGVPTHAEFNIMDTRPGNKITFGKTPFVVEFRWVDKA